MAIFKASLLFQSTSGISTPNIPLHRTGGWSESWYVTSASSSGVLNQLQSGANPGALSLLAARAALLGVGTAIVGIRIQQVSPPGPSQSISVNYPGAVGTAADIPQMALLCKVPGLGVNNIRRFTLRGIPDIQVTEGEFQPVGTFGAAVASFGLALQNYFFRGRDLSQPSFRIVNISSAAPAIVTCEANPPFAVGNMVRILRSVDSGKNLRGGRFQVASTGPLVNQFAINGWPYGATTLGSCRLDAVIYPPIDFINFSVSRAVTRRVGRPFVAYRGRRSKRRG